jgi:UDP-N-acetylglucosamine acyltransferase
VRVHPTSVISPEVVIEEGVEIGPYCLIQGKGRIGKGTFVEGHVTLGSRFGRIEIGQNNHFAPGSVIGGPPQDISYKNEETSLFIGDNNVFREFSTANIGTAKGTKKTVIGSNCYLMAYTHIGHDCVIGNNVIIANDSHLGGHCEIEDGVTIGGVCAFNQFTRVGKNAFIGGGSVVNKDILPYSKAHGDHAVVRATNKIGMQRKGFSREEIDSIHKAIRIIVMGSATIDEGIERIRSECHPSAHLDYFINFIKTSKRGIAR